jgi:magnesium-transporting ATPase (P-type)
MAKRETVATETINKNGIGCAAPWCKSASDVLRAYKVDVGVGLSSAEVEARRALYGPNELAKEPATPLWKLIAEQFDDTLVKVGVAVWCPAAMLISS